MNNLESHDISMPCDGQIMLKRCCIIITPFSCFDDADRALIIIRSRPGPFRISPRLLDWPAQCLPETLGSRSLSLGPLEAAKGLVRIRTHPRVYDQHVQLLGLHHQ